MPSSLPCDACSFRRVKCDGKNPCSTCLRREQPCTYLKVRKRRGPKGPRRSTDVRVQAMQKSLGITKSCSIYVCSPQASNDLLESQRPESSISANAARRRISLSTYCMYIDIFRSRLYIVWPIVSTNCLKASLSDISNVASYSLASALCAATLAQLRLPGHSPNHQPSLVTSGDFVRECLRFRACCDYQSSASLESLLTSLFLHMYYANVDQVALATFALRDAITHAHLLDLGNGQMGLESLRSEEHQLRLRVYWILLLTERTFCMQHDLPITLQTIDRLPVPVDDGDSSPALLTGFCTLARLFTRIDGPLIQTSSLSSPHPTYSRARITEIQEGLQIGATKNPIIDEVQRVDIWITQAWLSSLLWQYSASHYLLTSESEDAFFAPNYPFIIARNFLSLVCSASLESVRPHGYGMEIKLFKLANSLIDVLVYVPSLLKAFDRLDWGPRHAVVALEHLLDLVAGGKSERLDHLRVRMTGLNYTPTPRRALRGIDNESMILEPAEAPLTVGEIQEVGDTDGEISDSWLGEYQWFDEGTKGQEFEVVERELDTTVVSSSPETAELFSYGEDSYEFPMIFSR